jgi:chemotaxis protein CheX
MSLFRVEKANDIAVIHFPPRVDLAAVKDFAEQVKVWAGLKVNSFAFDLTGVTVLNRDVYKSLIQFKASLKPTQRKIGTVNVSSLISKQLASDGMEQVFNLVESLAELAPSEKPKHGAVTFDVDFVNPFLNATEKTLAVQCNTQLKALKPYLKTAQIEDVAVAGVLSLISHNFSGSIILCFSAPVFLKIYENMLGEKHEKITVELEDAAGELLNIIYGMAKIELNKKGYNFRPTLPTVLTGEKLVIRQNGSKPVVIVPFEVEAGHFHIEIEIDSNSEGKVS